MLYIAAINYRNSEHGIIAMSILFAPALPAAEFSRQMTWKKFTCANEITLAMMYRERNRKDRTFTCCSFCFNCSMMPLGDLLGQ